MKMRIKILLLAVGTVLAVQSQLLQEIVFSDQPLNHESPQNLKNDFKAGEHIFAVAYITNAVINLYHNQSPNANLQAEVFIYEKNAARQLSAATPGTTHL